MTKVDYKMGFNVILAYNLFETHIDKILCLRETAYVTMISCIKSWYISVDYYLSPEKHIVITSQLHYHLGHCGNTDHVLPTDLVHRPFGMG